MRQVLAGVLLGVIGSGVVSGVALMVLAVVENDPPMFAMGGIYAAICGGASFLLWTVVWRDQ